MTNRSMSVGVLTLALALGATACAKPAPDAAKPGDAAEAEPLARLGLAELEAKMAEAKAGTLELALFDNNARERFDKGHIPGARWVKFNAVQASDLPANKAATLVFYCANEH